MESNFLPSYVDRAMERLARAMHEEMGGADQQGKRPEEKRA